MLDENDVSKQANELVTSNTDRQEAVQITTHDEVEEDVQNKAIAQRVLHFMAHAVLPSDAITDRQLECFPTAIKQASNIIYKNE
jgi:hypothetical protein